MDTIKEWGEKLIRQHRRADLLTLPEFMQPKVVPNPQLQKPLSRNNGLLLNRNKLYHPNQGLMLNQQQSQPRN
jgi:hypothetical protein